MARKKSACGRWEDLTKLTHMEFHIYIYIERERERERERENTYTHICCTKRNISIMQRIEKAGLT